jgi:hypothetical protein
MNAPSDIAPLEKLYSFGEAAKLIPSVRGGTLHTKTLHAWRRQGLLTAYRRKLGNVESWFLPESEIIRLRGQAVPAATVEEPEPDDISVRLEQCKQMLSASALSHLRRKSDAKA